MKFYAKCDKGHAYHVSVAYGCPICNNPLLEQVKDIDWRIDALRKRRAELLAAYEKESEVTA